MVAARPALPLLLLGSLLLVAGCKSSDPQAWKPKLKTYLTERLRKHGFRDLRTDDDSRARPPTKYQGATKGLAYALRHTAKFEEVPVTVGTWVYAGKAARDAAKAPFQDITADLAKEQRAYKWWPVDFADPDLHLLMVMDAPELSVENHMQLVHKEMVEQYAEIKQIQ